MPVVERKPQTPPMDIRKLTPDKLVHEIRSAQNAFISEPFVVELVRRAKELKSQPKAFR